MSIPYKVVVSSKNLYREFLIKDGAERFKLGTVSGCDFRLNGDKYFEPVELSFQLDGNQWVVMCNDEVYLSAGGAKRLMVSRLNHGDCLAVRYASSDIDVFKLEFLINFEAQIPKYDAFIEVSNKDVFSVGSIRKCDLMLCGDYTEGSEVFFRKKGAGFEVIEKASPSGVYINGKRLSSAGQLEEHDFCSISDVFFYYKDGKLYFDCKKVTCVSFALNYAESSSVFKYPLFIRNTRRTIRPDNTPISVLPPGPKPQKPETNVALSLLPTIVMFVLVVVLRGVMSSNGATTYVLFSICSMGLGVFTSIANIVSTQKKYKTDVAKREDVYKNYIENKETEIATARDAEVAVLNEIYYSPRDGLKKVINFDSDIFDRTPSDEDFLDVCLGIGHRLSMRPVEYKPQEQLEPLDELFDIPQQLESKYRFIENAPITISLKNAGAVGISGEKSFREELFKSIVADIVVRQFHTDVRMYVLLGENYKDFDWLKQLPQLQRENGGRNIVFDAKTKTAVFEELFKELNHRDKTKGVNTPIVVLSLDNNGIVNHPISKFVETASELATTFIFFEERADFLPQYCTKVIELSEVNKGVVYSNNDRLNVESFLFESIGYYEMEALVQKVAPVYSKEINLESNLRKSITFFEMLGIYAADDIDLSASWSSSRIGETMAAPLGVNAKDEMIYLDLHEKAHGPHGLVAGTTGSGKSEILQSYILSVALKYHPYEVAFVIIDFKGGGMVNQFSELPHLIGAITNIDGKEIDRSLKSIRAELLKRQTLFAEAGVNNIGKYIKAYKEGKVGIPLPHLIIIVDEFAELKAEQPEFMKELISASRIGRSLGVHLILATQKPAGQVSEQIWSNSKFKLCLKVQDQQDSQEVIKSPLAAEIKEPGRAYLQVGNNEIFELFQSAYSGGKAVRSENDNKKPIVINRVTMGGRQEAIYRQTLSDTEKSVVTELEAVVAHIADYCKTNAIERLSPICLPSLLDEIDYPDSLKKVNDFKIPLGIYDDPDNQSQKEVVLDMALDNVLVIGSSQTGKTNLVQLILRTVGQFFSPYEVNVYIMDFASMTLKHFEKMNHVGGVILPGEDEKLKNFFKLLRETLQERKERLLEAGLSSFNAYLEAGYEDFPRIVVALENFAVFQELYEDKYDAEFQSIAREGTTYGISFVVTNAQTAGIGYKYMSNFGRRIALSCNDLVEYNNLFDRCKIQPKEIPGRIVFEMQGAMYEAQTYLAFKGCKEVERAAALTKFIDTVNEKNYGKKAKRIPAVPDLLPLSYVLDNYKINRQKYVYPIGLNYSDVDLVNINGATLGELCIVGNDTIKREKALLNVLEIIKYKMLEDNVRLYILDSFGRSLKNWQEHPYVDKYTVDCDTLSEAFENCTNEIERRQEWLKNEELEKLEAAPLLIYIVNNEMAIETISNTKGLADKYQEIAKQAKNFKILFIFSSVDDVTAGYSAPSFLKTLRDGKKAIIVSRLSEVKLYDIAVPTVRAFSSAKSSDVFYMNGSDLIRMKMIEESREAI